MKINITKDFDLINVGVENYPINNYDITEIESIAEDKKNFTEPCVLINIDEELQRIVLFSESFISDSQKFISIDFSELTASEQTIINDFINLF